MIGIAPMLHGFVTRRGVGALAALVAVAPLAAALAQAAPPQDGRALLETNCARCHAVSGVGPSPLPKAPTMREVARKYNPDNLGEALAEGIVTGHPEMPEFVFEPDEIAAIIDYLRGLRAGP